MKITDIDAFFSELDKRIDTPIRVLITGGAAAILFGADRATQDIDFEVQFRVDKRKAADVWPALQKAMDETARNTGIAAQYSDDIDRWSSILIPEKKSRLYKKIGKIHVRTLEPSLWAIGKLSRYLDSDVIDLVDVLSKTNPTPVECVRIWGKALGGSPPSPSQSEFQRHVDQFIDSHANSVWGKNAKPVELKAVFLKAAQRARNT